MFKKTVFVLLAGLSLLSSATYAGSPNTMAHVTYSGVYGNGRLFIAFDTVINEPGCPKSRVDIGPQHAQIDNWLSIAQNAMTTGKPVVVRTNGCYGGFPTLDNSAASWFYLR